MPIENVDSQKTAAPPSWDTAITERRNRLLVLLPAALELIACAAPANREFAKLLATATRHELANAFIYTNAIPSEVVENWNVQMLKLGKPFDELDIT